MADPSDTPQRPPLRPWNDWLAAWQQGKGKNATAEQIEEAHQKWLVAARKESGIEAPSREEEAPRYLRRPDPLAPPGSAAEAERAAAAREPPPPPKPAAQAPWPVRALRAVEAATPVGRPIAAGVRQVERPFEWMGGKVTEAIDPMRARHAVAEALARRGVPKWAAKGAGRAAQKAAELPGGFVGAFPQLAAMSAMPELDVPFVTKYVPKALKYIPKAYTKGAVFGPLDPLARWQAGERPAPTLEELGRAAHESGKQFVEFETGEKALGALYGGPPLEETVGKASAHGVDWFEGSKDRPVTEKPATPDQPTPPVRKDVDPAFVKELNTEETPATHGKKETPAPGMTAQNERTDKPGSGAGGTDPDDPGTHPTGQGPTSRSVPPGVAPGDIRESDAVPETAPGPGSSDQFKPRPVGPIRDYFKRLEEEHERAQREADERARTTFEVGPRRETGVPRNYAEYMRRLRGEPAEPPEFGVSRAEQLGLPRTLMDYLRAPQEYRATRPVVPGEPRGGSVEPAVTGEPARAFQEAAQPVAPVEPPTAPVAPPTAPVAPPTAEQLQTPEQRIQSVVRRAADEMRDAATGTRERGHYRGELRRAARVLKQMLGPEEAGRYIRDEVGDGPVTRALEDILGDQLKRPKAAAPGGRPGRGVVEAKPTTTSVLPTEPEKPLAPTKAAVEAERPEDAELGPRVVGREGTIHVEGFPNTPFRYEVVEDSDLVTSHDTEGNPNPDYPADLQQRGLDREAYRETQRKIRKEMAPERLGESPSALEGAPVVRRGNNVVLGGKQRTAHLQGLAEGSAAAETYRNWLRQTADKFGIDPAGLEGFERPTLIRRLTRDLTPEEEREFAPNTDVSPSMELSPAEKAAVDAKRLTPAILEHLDVTESGNLNTAGNLGFIRAFMAQIPGTERGRLVTAEGFLNDDGLRRVQNAVLARAYNVGKALHPAVGRMFESTDERVKTIQHGLLRAATEFAAYRGLVDSGELDLIDVMTPLLDATSTVSALRTQKLKIEDWLRQEQLGGKDPTLQRVLQGFADNTTVPGLTEWLKDVARIVTDQPRKRAGDLFERPKAPTPAQVFDLVRDPDLVKQDMEDQERVQQAVRDIDREIRQARAVGDYAKVERLEEQKRRLKQEEPC